MRAIKKGATSQSVYLVALDSTSTTGGRKTGLLFNTAGLTAYYVRNQGSATAITLATLAAANSAYSSGGFKEVDATNMPGVYRLDVPDAAFASGADSVVVTVKGATGMVQADVEVQLTGVDLQDATAMGVSRIDAAISSRMATFTLPTNFSALAITAGGAVTVGTNNDKTGYSLTQAFPANFSSLAITVGGAVTAGTVSDKTGYSLTQSFPTNFASLAITVGGAVTAGTVSDKTGYSLTQAFPTNFSALAITAGGAVTAGTVSDKTGYALTAAYDPAKTASQAGDAMTLTAAYDFAKGTVAVTESYAANGVAPTPVQALLGIHQMLMQFAIGGTSYTVKKLDNTTTAFVVTLDDATNPTGAART